MIYTMNNDNKIYRKVSVYSIHAVSYRMSERIKRRYQQFRAMYHSGSQICCRWSTRKLGFTFQHTEVPCCRYTWYPSLLIYTDTRLISHALVLEWRTLTDVIFSLFILT